MQSLAKGSSWSSSVRGHPQLHIGEAIAWGTPQPLELTHLDAQDGATFGGAAAALIVIRVAIKDAKFRQIN